MENSALKSLLKKLKEEKKIHKSIDYYIPSLWIDSNSKPNPTKVEAYSFYENLIEDILGKSDDGINYAQSISKIQNQHHGIGGDWTYKSVIYNLFPRLTTAYDHDHDGFIGSSDIDLSLNENGVRETGTFLKCIAMLPYIKSLGCNTIYFLPITSIGKDGNKGDLGSPYAIRNPYELDQSLADPIVGKDVVLQFKAFVEAAHIMGFRVMLEFVLRTSALDGDWIKTNPEWFYWIKQGEVSTFKSPEFSEDDLEEIKLVPEGKGVYHAPNKTYRNIFSKPPSPEQIKKEGNKYVAETEDGKLVIPGAFADWPPDDIQPAWSDVTYLRMYDFPYSDSENDFNYMAYNTIRYYDPVLSHPKNVNRPLWDKLVGVIPHYQETFGIDGVMMDMGHALPKPLMTEVIDKARSIDPDFAFCEENFDIDPNSRMAGFNATLGFEWRVTGNAYVNGGIKDVIYKSGEKLPLPFFGTSETHNTPRTVKRGGVQHSKLCWMVSCFMPSSIPFIHSGFEILERKPVNTGLNFTEEETEKYGKKNLALFYRSSYDWDNTTNIVPYIQKVLEIREQFFKTEEMKNHLVGNELSFRVVDIQQEGEDVIAFERFDPWHQNQTYLIVSNTNYQIAQTIKIKLEGMGNKKVKELITDERYQFNSDEVHIIIKKGDSLIFKLEKY
ncbi:alpha-amylase family protein [Sediminitomix flava]|uniref:Glycosidase n=1 Tax=Sediminitomix flava TaxID=379075 RepID=A0A315ZC55_SEDFL|nr:alpha-amylase [Sediminitomix flava]PWJ42388.1 hypothetical protein BC781_103640 [Sediminitomix flava]